MRDELLRGLIGAGLGTGLSETTNYITKNALDKTYPVKTDDTDWGLTLARMGGNAGMGALMGAQMAPGVGKLPSAAAGALLSVLTGLATQGLEKKRLTNEEYGARIDKPSTSIDINSIPGLKELIHDILAKTGTDNLEKEDVLNNLLNDNKVVGMIMDRLNDGASPNEIINEWGGDGSYEGPDSYKDITKAYMDKYNELKPTVDDYHLIKGKEYKKEGSTFKIAVKGKVLNSKEEVEAAGNPDGRWVTIQGRKVFIVNKE
jgi:hypothetical protein